VRTDGDDECSITILLRSAILIASDALIIFGDGRKDHVTVARHG